MYLRTLNKADTTLLKGFAILLIAAHNFMHLFPGPLENQFYFDPQRTLDFLNLTYSEPENILRTSLSFLGHLGVQVFVFLSAYGLMKKHRNNAPTYWRFIGQRWLKIFPSFLLAILFWLIIEGWVVGGYGILGPVKVLYWNIDYLLLKVSLISNFIPGMSLQPMGPWWFIPLIFQFYFIFPFLLRLDSRFGPKSLLALSVASILLASLTNGMIGELNIYFTVLGHLPVLCLGLYLAHSETIEIQQPMHLVLSALGLFVLGNFHPVAWHLNHIAALLLMIALFQTTRNHIKGTATLKNILLFYGNISMPLFLVNGFTREPFISLAILHDHWLLTISLCLTSLAAATLVAMALARLVNILLTEVDPLARLNPRPASVPAGNSIVSVTPESEYRRG